VLGHGELTVGLDVDAYGGESHEERPLGPTPLRDLRFRNTAGYAAYQHTFGNRVKVTPSAGLRYTDSRDFGGQWGGQAGIAVSGGFGQTHLRWAHAFNLPGVWVAALYQGYGRGDEWRSLEPEGVDHWELGYLRSLGSRARLDLLFFRDRVENALRFVAPPPPPPSFANTGRAAPLASRRRSGSSRWRGSA
jgi:outer membrane cobalamin receptor